jgi:hypothetical protein
MAYGKSSGGGKDTPAGEGKAASGGKGSTSCSAHKMLMAATKAGGKSFMSEAAGKLSEKTKG